MLWGSEQWLLSGVAGSVSRLSDGTGLDALIEREGPRLLGRRLLEQFHGQFPLLVKVIDARLDLSIQVHPDDVMARREHGKMGKTEMWYVMQSAPGAQLIDGFRRPLSPDDYERAVSDGSIEDYLGRVPVSSGDVLFIPAGRVHGIGAGLRIAEIQQTSDVTYRLYDYRRRDSSGRERELHTALAKQAIRFGELTEQPKACYTPRPGRLATAVHCSAFSTGVLSLPVGRPVEALWEGLDECVVLMCVRGSARLSEGGEALTLRSGECCLCSASAARVAMAAGEGDGATLLVSHVPQEGEEAAAFEGTVVAVGAPPV